MKILITDDSRMARRMVKKTLLECIDTYEEILEGSNGQEAIDIYKEHQPDVVFLDLTMPVKTGFEALNEIIEFDKNAKVIVISADIQKAAMDKVREAGALTFIKKPISTEKMTQILEKI
jgi:DNA-binding NarL/FixJ family response regulator